MGKLTVCGVPLGDRSGVSAHTLADPMRQLVPRQVSGDETLAKSLAVGNTPPGAVATLVTPWMSADMADSAPRALPCRARNAAAATIGSRSPTHPPRPPRRLMCGNVLA